MFKTLFEPPCEILSQSFNQSFLISHQVLWIAFNNGFSNQMDMDPTHLLTSRIMSVFTH